MTGMVLTEREAGVCTLTLNNPRKKNALSLAMLAELEQSLEPLQDDSDLRAVILQGAEGTFSVGRTLPMSPERWQIRRLTTASSTCTNSCGRCLCRALRRSKGHAWVGR